MHLRLVMICIDLRPTVMKRLADVEFKCTKTQHETSQRWCPCVVSICLLSSHLQVCWRRLVKVTAGGSMSARQI